MNHMNVKVPIFIPAQNFIPIEKENQSGSQNIKTNCGGENRVNKLVIKDQNLQDNLNMNQNEQPKQNEKQKQNNIGYVQRTPSLSTNCILFDDNDFLIADDNSENGIAANLQSLDMKRYSDRNNYFNNSIRTFNLQKNQEIQNNNISSKNGLTLQSQKKLSLQNFNLQLNDKDNNQLSISDNKIYTYQNMDISKKSSVTVETQESIRNINETKINTHQFDYQFNQKQQSFNLIKDISNHDEEQKQGVNLSNSDFKQQSKNNNNIRINSSSTSNNNNNNFEQQSNQLDNQVKDSQDKFINVSSQQFKQQDQKNNQGYIPDSLELNNNDLFLTKDHFLNENIKINNNYNNDVKQSENNDIKQNEQYNQINQTHQQNNNLQSHNTLNLQENICMSSPCKSKKEIKNLQQIQLFQISHRNSDDNLHLQESSRNNKFTISSNYLQSERNLDQENNIQLGPPSFKNLNEKKFFSSQNNISGGDCYILDDSNVCGVEDQEVSFDQSKMDLGHIQKHQIMNSHFNVFVVKKNVLSPTNSQSGTDFKIESKFQFYNQSTEDQKAIYESDMSTKNLSFPNIQLFSDLEPMKTAHFNRLSHNKQDIINEDSQDISQTSSQKNDQMNNQLDQDQLKNISTILKSAENDDIKSYPQTPNEIIDNLTHYFRLQPEIIKSLFLNDMYQLKKLLHGFSNLQKNTVDFHGNTLLYISTKLALNNNQYFDIFKYLLQNGANPKIRNKEGWSPLDESIFAKNVRMTTTLFEYIYQAKKKKISEQLIQLETILPTLPDCYIEIKWHFESMIPFLGYFAPSDTFRFWKVGNSFRLDTTLVGFSNLKCKRRNMSLVFKDSKLFLINKTNKTITNPQEDLDIEEKKKIIQDLLESKPFQSTVDVTQCTVSQSKTWNGKVAKKKIANYNSIQYSMKLVYECATQNKPIIGDKRYENYDNYYKEQNKIQSLTQSLTSSNKIIQQKAVSTNGDTTTTQNTKDKEKKKANFSIWMSKEYPIHFKQFLPLLQVLERSNPMLSKLNEFLNKQQVKDLIQNEGFPVKIQIPLNYTIKTTIDFSDFKFLEGNKQQELNDLFIIDPSYQVIPRKEAQKTLTRSKKRMILANMITA